MVDHRLDAFKFLPVHVTLVRTWDERYPSVAAATPRAYSGDLVVVLGMALSLTVGVGTGITRVAKNAMYVAVARTAPMNIAIDRPSGDRQLVLDEPEEYLSRATEFEELREHEFDR
jgi:hypothetical protein